jgi:hypothetical protein
MKHKTEHEGFVRDSTNQALLNTNADAYTRYKERRQLQHDNAQLKEEIDSLKGDVSTIKQMLELLLLRDNNGPSNS